MSVTVTSTGIGHLRAELLTAAKDAPKKGRKVLSKGALNIKRSAQGRARGLAHAPYYPAAITYDVQWSGLNGSAETGPDKDRRQGALGNVLEYGTKNNAPIPSLGPALDEETPRFEKAVGDLGVELLS